MNASQSITWLKSQICTAGGAVNSLSRLLALVNVLDIFRQCFPREFKKYARGIGQGDSERIIVEFLQLVNGRLFELNEVYLEDEESYEYACYVIPISSFTPDWYNQDPSDLPMVYKIILLLDGHLSDSYFDRDRDAFLQGFRPAVQEALGTPQSVNRSDLQWVCQRTRGPLRDLYLAFEIVFKIVPDNIWLQISDEDYSEIPWGIEEVRNLAKQYREAIASLARFRRLEEWVQADPDRRIPKVVDLWSKARKLVRVKVGAKTLAQTFATDDGEIVTPVPVRVRI